MDQPSDCPPTQKPCPPRVSAAASAIAPPSLADDHPYFTTALARKDDVVCIGLRLGKGAGAVHAAVVDDGGRHGGRMWSCARADAISMLTLTLPQCRCPLRAARDVGRAAPPLSLAARRGGAFQSPPLFPPSLLPVGEWPVVRSVLLPAHTPIHCLLPPSSSLFLFLPSGSGSGEGVQREVWRVHTASTAKP